MFALMHPDLTFSGQIKDGTTPVQWNNVTLPPLRQLSKADRVANFIYDFVQAQGLPPYTTGGGTTYSVNKTTKTVTETVAALPWDADKLATYKSDLCNQIDKAAEQASAKYALPSAYIMQEYLQAESDAKAFIAAPTGACPLSVSCWAQSNVAMTNLQAAQDITARAAQYRGLLSQIRSIRLLGKAAVNGAIDGAAVDVAKAATDDQYALLP